MDAVYRPPFFRPPPILWVPAKNYVFGSATMAGTGDLTAVGKQSAHGAATMSGAGDLTAAGKQTSYGVATMSGTGDLSATGKLPISGIKDSFSDNVVASFWSETETGGGTVTETGQQLECAVPGSAVATAYLMSQSRYDLTEDAAYVRLVSPGLNNTLNLQAAFLLGDAGGTTNSVWIVVTNNLTVFGYTLAGVDNQTNLTYNATNHAWLRIVHSGSNVLWQTSPDASTWTTRRTVATPITITDLQVRLGQAALTTGPGASTVIFDGFNTTASEVFGAATMSGAGALTASGTTRRYGAATMSGTGALTAAGKQLSYGAATMAGTGDLTATGHVQNLVAMSGAGALSADGFVPTYERPSGTISAGSWTPVGAGTLWEAIDETTAVDSDYIVSSSSPGSPDICEVALSNVANPGVDTGHIVRYRFQKDTVGGDTINLTVRLVEGTTVIASWTESNIGATATDAIHELTTGEASAITDYTDLRLRFEAVKV